MSNIYEEDSTVRRKTIGRLILIFLGVMLILTFFSNTIMNFSLPRVKAEQPSSGAIVREIMAEGAVEAKKTVNIYAGAGRLIEEIRVKTGDIVEEGQILAVLDKKQLEERLEEETIRYEKLKLNLEKLTGENAKADLKHLERSIEQAKRVVENAEKDLALLISLYDMGAESQANLDKAREDVEDAKEKHLSCVEAYNLQKMRNDQEVKGINFDLELQEMKLDKIKDELLNQTVIKAPCKGIVKELGFTEGTYTRESVPLCVLTDIAAGFQFKAGLDREMAKYLSPGDEVEINIKSLGGKRMTGILEEITVSNENYNMMKLFAEISQEELSGGEPGDMYISKKTRFYDILVPNSAINSDDRGKFIYILKEKKGPLGNEYYVQKTGVTVDDWDNFRTAIISGIDRQDRIIVNTDKYIFDGSRVMLSR